MRLSRRFAVVFVAITAEGCTPSAPPEPIRTEIVEELPPTVCNLQKDDDGQDLVVIGTLHLDGLAITLEDSRCPAVRVDLTKKTAAPVNFTIVGNGILVRLRGTYHREPRNQLDVAWIEPEAAFEKGTP